MSLTSLIMGDMNRKRRMSDDDKRVNQSVAIKMATTAAENRDLEAMSSIIDSLSEYGVDPRPFAQMAARSLTPEEKREMQMNEVLGGVFQSILGNPQQIPQAIGEMAVNDAGLAPPPPAPPPGIDLRNPQNATEAARNDLLFRAAAKKYADVTVGQNTLYEPQWYASHAELVRQGYTKGQATEYLAGKFGFIPSGASSLTDNEFEHNLLFEKGLSANLADPQLDKEYRTESGLSADAVVDPNDKLGWTLNRMSFDSGTPDYYKDVLERWRGHNSPIDYMTDEQKTQIMLKTGVNPNDLHWGDMQAIGRILHMREVEDATDRIKKEEHARFESTFEQPIPLAAATALGLPVDTTNEQLYHMKVIPLGKDDKLTQIQAAKNLLGVLEGISKRLFTAEGFNRFTKGGQLKYEKFVQSNPDLAAWDGLKQSMAFLLARVYGGTGVITQQDVAPYLKNIPGAWHSKTFAEGFSATQRKVLDMMESTIGRRTALPSEGLTAEDQALMQAYEKMMREAEQQ